MGTVCNSPYRNFISKNPRLGASLHPTPTSTAVVVNFPLASPLLQNAIGRGGLGGGGEADLTSGKVLKAHGRTVLPGTSGVVLGWRLGARDSFLAPLPTVLGTQGPWSWYPELLGPISSQAGTLKEMNIFRGWLR